MERTFLVFFKPHHLARILIYNFINGKPRVIGGRKATGPYKFIYTKRVAGLPTNCRRYDRALATLFLRKNNYKEQIAYLIKLLY